MRLEKPYRWPNSWGKRSRPFQSGFEQAHRWLLDGDKGASISPFRPGAVEFDAWQLGWDYAAHGIGAAEVKRRGPTFKIEGLTVAGKVYFEQHLAQGADPKISIDDHYRAMCQVVESQLNGTIIGRTPPWSWEPTNSEGQEGFCKSYTEQHFQITTIARAHT
ncbi:hypothetical protein RYA05_03640 [Pseudomonas syringae pv. actinidiae]|nr:hypothetical protein [Pseudomonas syringae pv. actinidiae]